jgi:TonB family protein
MRLLLPALVAVSSVASAQECPQGPADSLANAGLGASVAHWPFTPAILESAARAVFNDFGYTLVQPENRAQPFTTRASRRRPDHPLLVSFPADEHPGVVLSLEVVPEGDSTATRLAVVARCALGYPPEARAEDTYEYVLAEEFLLHLVGEAKLRGTPGGIGFHVLAPAGTQQRAPDRDWCPVPRFPGALRSRDIEGFARLAFVVDTTGRVERSSIEVLETTHREFGKAGAEMIRDCRFRPAEVDGVPVRARTVMPIMFRLAPRP